VNATAPHPPAGPSTTGPSTAANQTAAQTAAPATARTPGPGGVWRAARLPVAIGLLVVVTGVLVASVAGQPVHGLLNPDAVDPSGSRALAQLLRDQGVTVTVVRSSAELTRSAPGATVLVARPDELSTAQLRAVRGAAADLVVVAPGQRELTELAPQVELTTLRHRAALREPGCALPAAQVAGPAELGGERYRAPGGIECYADDGGAAVVQVVDQVDGAGRTVTVLGAPEPLTNGELAGRGNAALALRLLGIKPTLLWYRPGPEPSDAAPRTLGELVPPGWRWAAVQLALAAVLAAVWRARRLGPVVREPLPVVVRAVEAVEGRARLYRRAGARGHAADTLRAATRARLAPLLGLGRPDGEQAIAPEALVDAVAARTGRTPAGVTELLYGAAPADERAMVELADRLDECEREVLRT
jgi:hypothetical protein